MSTTGFLGRSPTGFHAELINHHPADIAERLNVTPRQEARALVDRLPVECAIEVFDQPELWNGAELLRALPEEKGVAIVSDMAPDRLVDLVRAASVADRAPVFALMDSGKATTVRRLLDYPRDSAGSIMTTEFVGVPATATVAEVLESIRAIHHTRETVYPIYILDPATGALIQTVSLRRLITRSPTDPILSLATDRKPVTVTPRIDREEVARLISRHDLLAPPRWM